jgi:hypothetical protein
MHSRARQSKATNPPSHDEASRSLTRPVPSNHPLNHPLLKLQRAIGNQGTQRLLRARLEGSPSVPPIAHDVLLSSGQPLHPTTRALMESRFGHNFSRVRVHADARAAEAARAVNASAYTIGQDIVFDAGQYTPATSGGRKLLAHELVHTLQQAQSVHSAGEVHTISAPGDPDEREAAQVADKVVSASKPADFTTPAQPILTRPVPPTLQRDLLAYKTEHTEVLPSMDYVVYTADAANIRNALQVLISANKVSFRDVGDRTFFSNRGATRVEIISAFTAAGYSRANDMADALMDEHNISVYSRGQIAKMTSLFGTFTVGQKADVVVRQLRRPLTDAERTEAQLVFGRSLDYDRIVVEEDPIMGAFGTARTTPLTVNFPPGSFGGSGFMPWLIHELTHSWQYQHGISFAKTSYYGTVGFFYSPYYDYGGEAGLLAAQAAGKHFRDFNPEQQGSILGDYYKRLKKGKSISAWLPFVIEVQTL